MKQEPGQFTSDSTQHRSPRATDKQSLYPCYAKKLHPCKKKDAKKPSRTERCRGQIARERESEDDILAGTKWDGAGRSRVAVSFPTPPIRQNSDGVAFGKGKQLLVVSQTPRVRRCACKLMLISNATSVGSLCVVAFREVSRNFGGWGFEIQGAWVPFQCNWRTV